MIPEASESAKHRIRVAVADAHDLLREGVVALLATTPDMECVGAWENAERTLALLPPAGADILLLSVTLSERLLLIPRLRALCPGTRVLVTVDCSAERCVVLHPYHCGESGERGYAPPSGLPPPDDCLQLALKAGAHGVLRQRCPFEQVARAIRTVAAGKTWIEPETAQRLACQYLFSLHAQPQSLRAGVDLLTAREGQVLTLVARGRSNKEIAQELRLGYSTVRNYVSSILRKLNLADRAQLILFAVNQQPPDIC